MQAQREQSQEEIIQALQQQVDELTVANLLLKEQLARQEQYTAMIAHDLRSPLSPIINYAQMLARHVCPPTTGGDEQSKRPNPTVQRSTNIIISQARRMLRLVNDLLDASHLSVGQFTLVRHSCDIVGVAKEILEQLRPVAPYHTLVLDAPDAAIIGNWDVGRLQQALGNLLDNAIKYSDEGSTVTVRIWTVQQSVVVSVHNQGVSIPPDEIGHLFRPYGRLQATSGVRQGTGLGLFITKSIIEAHQGTLRLEPHVQGESDEERRGTTFTFELPL